jgi:hypothetical protein
VFAYAFVVISDSETALSLITSKTQPLHAEAIDTSPFPQLGTPGWQVRWAGKVALTIDHMPRVHELAPGLRTCIGYNGRGVAIATAIGREFGKWTRTGDTDALPLPPSQMRPLSFHGRRPVLEVISAYYRMRDRFSWRGNTRGTSWAKR